MSMLFNLDRCDCSCHDTEMVVMHMMACCMSCHHCGEDRIMPHAYIIHIDNCPSNPKNLPPINKEWLAASQSDNRA